MRRFELTIGVYVGDEQELPSNFNEWIEQAGLTAEGATPTTLHRVVEVRHPPAEDVIEKRSGRDSQGRKTGGQYE